jgi:hypothetical protein
MPQIDYVGTNLRYDEFHLMADGNSDGSDRRPVLEIYVAQDNKIWIAGVEKPETFQATNGEVHRHDMDDIAAADPETAMLMDLCGAVHNGICMGALTAYVIPRIATLMARVYVPKVSVTE